ncbi:hypothetical protein Tco_0225543, partial [Tanacetum coccineum]
GDEIKKGSNLGGCDLNNESIGMTPNSDTTKKEAIADVIPACSGCEKTEAVHVSCFPACYQGPKEDCGYSSCAGSKLIK